MKALLIPFLFLSIVLLSCDDDDPKSVEPPRVSNTGNQIPTLSPTESSGYYIEGKVDNEEIKSQISVVSSSTSVERVNDNFVVLGYGMAFSIHNADGRLRRVFKIDFKTREALVNLDKQYNYKDPNRVNSLFSTGNWNFWVSNQISLDKGVSITYSETEQMPSKSWFTEEIQDQRVNHSNFECKIDKVAYASDEITLIVEGSLECVVRNSKNPDVEKEVQFKFKGPLSYSKRSL